MREAELIYSIHVLAGIFLHALKRRGRCVSHLEPSALCLTQRGVIEVIEVKLVSIHYYRHSKPLMQEHQQLRHLCLQRLTPIGFA